MLVLSRKVGEEIVVDNQVVITVLSIQGTRVRLGIAAPPNVPIRREEMEDRGSRIEDGGSRMEDRG